MASPTNSQLSTYDRLSGTHRFLRSDEELHQEIVEDVIFHPSLSGQAALARVTWAKSWWPTT